MVDTLRYSKELTQRGLPKTQAEGVVKTQYEMIKENVTTKLDLKESEFALRSEMKELAAELRSEMKQLATDLRSDMKQLESRLTIKLGSIMVAGITVLGILGQLQ